MGSRITSIFIAIGIFSITSRAAVVTAPADSTAAARPDSALTVQTTPAPIVIPDTTAISPALPLTAIDSARYQQEADQKLLLLMETDSTEQMLPVIKMLRLLEYADSIKAAQGSNEIPVNPLFMPIIFEEQMSTPLQHLPKPDTNPFKPKTLTVNDGWLQKMNQYEKTREMAQNYVIVNYPKLIHYNLDNLPEVPKQYMIENDPVKHILSIKEKPLIIKNDVGKENIKLKRWIVNFQSAVQFSQVFVSENWYQGGTSNVNLLSDQQFSIKYNDPKEQRILFENLIQWRLNINSAPEDTLRSVRISEDLFQINSKFGLKAYNQWYYTATLNFKTQFFTSHATNTTTKTAAFLSPAELNLGLGMSYQYKNDKKKFETSISLSPLSYNLQFVIDNDMDPTSFGIKSGKSMSQYGSSFEGRIKWEFYHNMVWSCRLFYFTNYEHVQGDWENTFDFILNRFFSTRLFVHLRYDDALALNKDLGHFQLKELFSFGFNYKF